MTTFVTSKRRFPSSYCRPQLASLVAKPPFDLAPFGDITRAFVVPALLLSDFHSHRICKRPHRARQREVRASTFNSIFVTSRCRNRYTPDFTLHLGARVLCISAREYCYRTALPVESICGAYPPLLTPLFQSAAGVRFPNQQSCSLLGERQSQPRALRTTMPDTVESVFPFAEMIGSLGPMSLVASCQRPLLLRVRPSLWPLANGLRSPVHRSFSGLNDPEKRGQFPKKVQRRGGVGGLRPLT